MTDIKSTDWKMMNDASGQQVRVRTSSSAATSAQLQALASLQETAPDPVNHPQHYRANGLESIDIIEAFGLGFHVGNVVKYCLRAGKKAPDPLEDLKKARWYLDREIARREKEKR